MISIKISSLIGNPIRQLQFPGFRNTFVIGKISIDSLSESRYAIIDRDSMVIITDAQRISDLIMRISRMLADMTQADLDEYIRTMQEYNE